MQDTQGRRDIQGAGHRGAKRGLGTPEGASQEGQAVNRLSKNPEEAGLPPAGEMARTCCMPGLTHGRATCAKLRAEGPEP